MANSFDEGKNSIWKFLMLALRSNVEVVRGEKNGAEISALANSQSVSTIMPAKYKNSNEIYDFRIGMTLYHISFNENMELQKDQEYFNRGSRFVKHLLDAIFNKFRILVVNNVIYPDIELNVAEFIDGEAELVAKENDSSTVASSNYRYRVGFSVVVKDQIDKKVTTETFSESLTMEPLNDSWVYSREAPDFSESVTDSDGSAAVTLPDQSERMIAIGEIAALLQTSSEKQIIFDIFLNDPNSQVAKHIAKREERAKQVADCGEVVYRYNVTALTMYIDKVQDKVYSYKLNKGGYSQTIHVRFNLKDGLKSIKCPHCGREITASDSNRICLALDKNKTPVIGCFECSVDLSESNDIYSKKQLCRYINESSCIVEANYLNKQRLFFIGDTYINVLDKKRYSNYGSTVPRYIFNGNSVSLNELQCKVPNSLDWVHTCPNCSSTYARREADKASLEKHICRTVDSEVVGCLDCADKPNAGKMNIYKSDLSDKFFVYTYNGVRCNICGKVGYRTELVSCGVCGRHVCEDCISSHYSYGICTRCCEDKTECDKKESSGVWEYVKSNIPLYRWGMKKRIYKAVDANGIELYYVVFSKSNIIYCFEKYAGKYILQYPIA